MDDRFHTGTLLWGVVLTLSGLFLTAVGFGWWDVSSIDLRYVGPGIVILIGVVVLLAALLPTRGHRGDTSS